MIDIDYAQVNLPETMTWNEVVKFLEAIIPSEDFVRATLGRYGVPAQDIDRITDEFKDEFVQKFDEAFL